MWFTGWHPSVVSRLDDLAVSFKEETTLDVVFKTPTHNDANRSFLQGVFPDVLLTDFGLTWWSEDSKRITFHAREGVEAAEFVASLFRLAYPTGTGRIPNVTRFDAMGMNLAEGKTAMLFSDHSVRGMLAGFYGSSFNVNQLSMNVLGSSGAVRLPPSRQATP